MANRSIVYLVTIACLLLGQEARSDSSELLVQVGDCLANCSDPSASIRITSFGLGGSIQGYSPVQTASNDNGQVVFNVKVEGSGAGTGINALRVLRREPNGSLTILAKPGTPVRGIAGATLQTGASAFVPTAYKALFSDGSVLLDTYIQIAGVSGVTRGLVCLNGVDAEPLILNGSPVPQAPGTTFSLETNPYLHLEKPGCSAAVRATEMIGTVSGVSGVWEVQAGRSPLLIGKRLAQAPGLPQGVLFGQDITRPSYANQNYRRVEYLPIPSGYALTHSYLEGAGVRRDPAVDALPLNNAALWMRNPSGETSLIARMGDPAPGVPGVYFGPLAGRLYWGGSPGVPGYTQMQGGSITADGKYAFRAYLDDLSGDPYSLASGNSIWSNRSGFLRMERRTGDLFTDALTGQVWQISNLAVASQDQPGMYLSDTGSLFYSGSGYRVGLDPTGLTNPSRNFIAEQLLDGTMKVVAFEGQALPNRPDLLLGLDIVTNFFVTSRPSVLFASRRVTSSNERILSMYRENTLRASTRTGDAVPELGGVSLDPYLSYTVFNATSQGDYLWRAAGGIPALIVGNDRGALKFLVDPAGHFPSSTDSRLATEVNNCPLSTFNPLGDILLTCVNGNRQRLIMYHPDDSSVRCLSDFNSDGTLSVQDIFDFLTVWFAQGSRADVNGDSLITVQDLFDFLNRWFEGCA